MVFYEAQKMRAQNFVENDRLKPNQVENHFEISLIPSIQILRR